MTVAYIVDSNGYWKSTQHFASDADRDQAIAGRTDMTALAMPDASPGFWPKLVSGVWQLAPDTRAYAPPLSQVQAMPLAAIEQLRQQYTEAPIELDGQPFQADATARENIQGKVAEFDALAALGMQPPAGPHLWMDAANVPKTFDTYTDMGAFLRRLLVAITQRGTALYAVKWQHRQAIEALTDAEAVRTYDYRSGWA